VIAYRAMLDVPRELVREVARLLRAERRARGPRKDTRALTCWYRALLMLAWYRNQGDIALVGAGFGVSRATAYRYRDEVVDVLAAVGPGPARRPGAGRRTGLVTRDRRREGVPYRPLRRDNYQHEGGDDQRLVLREHRAPGGNIQAIMRPDGLPIWVSQVLPGHLHDITCARAGGVLGALYRSASQLRLPAPADSGYDGAGHSIRTPIKQPTRGQVLAPDNRAYNMLLRATRCLGERGFALLTGRWRALRRITASPSRIGDYVKAALVLTLIEQTRLRNSR
jgi:hypothetical protein